MSSIRLNPLDSAWLFTESRATPNHVGGLLEFRLPEGAPRDYMHRLMAAFRGHREFAAPWNRRLKYAFNKNPLPVWVEDDAIDLAFNAIMRQLISFMMEDPRTISNALEAVFIAKSIERIGDHAKNVAEQVVFVVEGRDIRHVKEQAK